MNTVFIVGVLFAFCTVMAVTETNLRNQEMFILYGLSGLVMVLIAGFRDGNTVGDYKNYLAMYESPDNYLTVESSFKLISHFTKAIGASPYFLFLIYAAIGISCKFIAIKRLTSLLFLSLVIYISNVFLLYDMTQMRAGVAAGIFLLAIPSLAARKGLHYLMLILFASFFHYSALALLPLYFINNRAFSVKSKYFWWVIIPFGFVANLLIGDITAFIPIEAVRVKLELYQQLQEQGVQGYKDANLLSPTFLFRAALYYFLLYKYDLIRQKNKYFPLLIKIEGIALFLFPALSFISLLGYRLSELFGMVEIILYPLIIYTLKPQSAAKAVGIGIGLLLLSVNIFYRHLIIIR